MSRRKDRLEFESYDGAVTARMGQGNHCVLIQVEGNGRYAGIVLTDDEAEAMAWSLLRRARYSRMPDAGPKGVA